jgi:hypothetical protein
VNNIVPLDIFISLEEKSKEFIPWVDLFVGVCDGQIHNIIWFLYIEDEIHNVVYLILSD